ncbi:MAG TPA: hypothetical protein VMZ02_06045 [Candidatus Limnocylindrales bacterium]|nr:hypothetical protein [Candidatus Limnocylindrales bacterium]
MTPIAVNDPDVFAEAKEKRIDVALITGEETENAGEGSGQSAAGDCREVEETAG